MFYFRPFAFSFSNFEIRADRLNGVGEGETNSDEAEEEREREGDRGDKDKELISGSISVSISNVMSHDLSLLSTSFA